MSGNGERAPLRRVLITGASGLLGRQVVRQMAGAFAPVCLGRAPPPMDADLEYIQADLNDPHFVNNLPSKIDAVLHLAQSEDYRAFPKLASNVFRVNVTSVASLLEWAQAAGATHFVQASTGGIVWLRSETVQRDRLYQYRGAPRLLLLDEICCRNNCERLSRMFDDRIFAIFFHLWRRSKIIDVDAAPNRCDRERPSADPCW